MVRKILSIALIVVGLAVIALAIASATVWKDSETVTASLPTTPETPLVVTEAGVLDLVAPDVTVTASAPDGAPVVLVIGRDIDVLGWAGDAGHVLVTGLTSWTELATTAVDGPGELPSPAGSDMWVAQATGDGTATLDWSDAPGRWSVLAATDGTAPAPQLSFTWQRGVTTPWLIPGLVVGALVLLAGVALGFFAMRKPKVDAPPFDRDAIRERLGAVPQRRKAGRHAPGTRPLETYAGTELIAANAGAEGAEGAEESELEPGAAEPEGAASEALTTEYAASSDEADEADESDADGPLAEFDDSESETDETEDSSDESAAVTLSDGDAADAELASGEVADVDTGGADADAEPAESLEEGEADEDDEAEDHGVYAEFDDSESETDDDDDESGDETLPARQTDPKGEQA